MPLKDWGLGLEEITEYYHRYGLYYTTLGMNKIGENWFMTRGLVDQKAMGTKHWKSKKSFGFWSPQEIDLIGFRIDHNCEIKEVRLIQCKEHVEKKMISNILGSFLMPRITGIIIQAEKQKILSKCVSYATISSNAKKDLEKRGILLFSFKTMTEKLLQLVLGYEKLKRKGFSREPIIWMIRSLRDAGFFDQEMVKTMKDSLSDVPDYIKKRPYFSKKG